MIFAAFLCPAESTVVSAPLTSPFLSFIFLLNVHLSAALSYTHAHTHAGAHTKPAVTAAEIRHKRDVLSEEHGGGKVREARAD